jgi:transposase-like protein
MGQYGDTMTHPIETKAQAIALLALGNSPRYVAAQLGIPRSTVLRWRPEAHTIVRELLGDPLATALATIGKQTDPKKGGAHTTGSTDGP